MAPPEAKSGGFRNEKERMWSSMSQMLKDTITAAVIGTLATYLPFWQWDNGTRWMGAVVLGVVAWGALVAMEPEKKNDHFRDFTKMHRGKKWTE